MLKADGFNKAIVGVGRRCGQPDLLVYDVHECINILIERDGMTEEQAMEYFDFNVVGSWVGESTPIFLYTGEEY
tara:strand:+ start:150 stop:371 length:222 start_codon:yes stop_codon:yes gene_type:complete